MEKYDKNIIKSSKKPSARTKKKPSNPVKKSVKNTQKTTKKAQKVRKARSDSVQGKVEAVQAALREIEPPEHMILLKAEMKFWDSIIDVFSKVEWCDHTLELAAMLARTMYAYDKAQRKLLKEGELLPRKAILKSKQEGVPDQEIITGYYANPIKGFIKMYHENILSMRRSLAMQSRVINGEPRDAAKGRGKAKALEDDLGDLDDKMNLIPFPKKEN